MKMVNLFSLDEQRQLEWIGRWVELMGMGSEWKDLASVHDHVQPHFNEVGLAIVRRLSEHPFTQHVEDISSIFNEVLPYYFKVDKPGLDYLKNRAKAGKAYLEAGFTPSTLAAKYQILIDEFSNIFKKLFADDPQLLLRLERSLVKVALLNYALALEQFVYEREEKFLQAAGISRELMEQMAKTVG